jgi:hypothetical protein
MVIEPAISSNVSAACIHTNPARKRFKPRPAVTARDWL